MRLFFFFFPTADLPPLPEGTDTFDCSTGNNYMIYVYIYVTASYGGSLLSVFPKAHSVPTGNFRGPAEIEAGRDDTDSAGRRNSVTWSSHHH